MGDWPRIRNHPLFKGLNLPPVGVVGSPGPMVTAGGLVFVSGGDAVLYAFDAATGRELWRGELGRYGYAVPMTYRTRDGRQFVVIASGGTARTAFSRPSRYLKGPYRSHAAGHRSPFAAPQLNADAWQESSALLARLRLG